MQILVLIVQWGLLAKQSKYYHLVTFFDCPVPSCPVLSLLFYAILRPGRTSGPIFTLYGSNDVFPRKDGPFWG